MNDPVIALLTDFGEDDFFVASLKAVILSLNPQARIVNISHRIPSFDIDAAGFVLWAAYKFFPQGTIFLAIVDPGVGSRRRILLVKTERYFFMGPDNGVLSRVLREETIEQIREIANPSLFLSPWSRTFEGRDKMAPAAAWLSRGKDLDMFGPRVKDFKRRTGLKARIAGGEIQGRILYKDKFGNLITNIPSSLLDRLAAKKRKEPLTLFVDQERLGRLKESYSAAKKGEVFFLVGSLGLIEISAREASAAEKIKSSLNQEIRIALTGKSVKK